MKGDVSPTTSEDKAVKRVDYRKHNAIPLDEDRYILAWDIDCDKCSVPPYHKPTKELLFQEVPWVVTRYTTDVIIPTNDNGEQTPPIKG